MTEVLLTAVQAAGYVGIVWGFWLLVTRGPRRDPLHGTYVVQLHRARRDPTDPEAHLVLGSWDPITVTGPARDANAVARRLRAENAWGDPAGVYPLITVTDEHGTGWLA